MFSLRQKVYQLFILGLDGGNYRQALMDGLGGIIFFTNDILSEEQFVSVTNECKNIALIKPFLSIDQEGGRVERTQNIHGGKKYLSAKYAFEQNVLRQQTCDIAKELSRYGVNLNFAPCIDVNTNPDNPIIAERAFSSRVEDVIEAEKIVSDTYRENGILPCVKHFPGHGDANVDSHLALPHLDLSFDEMVKNHISPFKSAIENGIEMVMVAHLHCSCFDDDVIPSSMSKNVISYLRVELGFKGVIISDDMVMKGVSDLFSPLEACVKGLKAGLNMFIFRNSTSGTIKMIEDLALLAEQDVELRNCIENSFEKILLLKEKIF